MKKPVALLLGLAALGVAGVETAAAQGLYYYGPGYYGQRYYVPGLAPWRIARIVRSPGMTPLSAPTRRGPVYEVVAIDPECRHVRVAVDAYRGAITGVRPVAVLRPNSEPYGSRVAVAPPPEQDEMVPGSRLGPTPSQPGAGRVPPQVLPPYAGPSQANASTAPLANAPYAVQPPQAAQPTPTPRIANAHPRSGATAPVETAPPIRVRARRCSNSRSHAGTKSGTKPGCRVRRRDCSGRSARPACAKPRAPDAPAAAAASAAAASASARLRLLPAAQHFAGQQRLVAAARAEPRRQRRWFRSRRSTSQAICRNRQQSIQNERGFPGRSSTLPTRRADFVRVGFVRVRLPSPRPWRRPPYRCRSDLPRLAASGISRTRSTCSRPFSSEAPFTWTKSASWNTRSNVRAAMPW